MNYTEWKVLGLLNDLEGQLPGVSIPHIRATTRTSESGARGALASLVGKGWVKMLPSNKENPQASYNITEEGRKALLESYHSETMLEGFTLSNIRRGGQVTLGSSFFDPLARATVDKVNRKLGIIR